MINYSFYANDLEYFLLIMIRIVMFVAVAPLFSQKGVPSQVKVGFSFFMAAVLYGAMEDRPILEYSSIWGYAVIVVKEAMAGLIIGFAANMCTTIVTFAGQIVDMETGLSMVNLMDPNTNMNVSISGVLYQYVITLMLLVSGLYQYMVVALAETYELIPVNGAVFKSERILESIVIFLNDYVSIGFRICLPVFAAMLLLNAILGIMTKVAPQLNMFSVGMQLKVLTGISTLFITVGMLPTASSMIFSEVKKMMATFVKAIM